jgi:hypothetical protein
MLKALLLLLAIGVNLTWATHYGFTDLTEAELKDMATTMAAIAEEAHDGDRLRKTRKLSFLDTFDNREAFNIAAPSLPLEDFEGSKALPYGALSCVANPLDVNEGSCYPSSSIEAGLGVFASMGTTAVLGYGVVPVKPSTWVGANLYTSYTSLVFTINGPTAVGLDFFNFFNFPGDKKIDIKIIFYEDNDTETVATFGDGNRFFGVIADKPIKEMIVGDAPFSSIVVDNVAFGTVLPAPPVPPAPGTVGTDGDPHFKTWRGDHYDYHGECDLVLLHSAEFQAGLGLDVHIRTKFRRDMSYISSAVLRIGSDVLEVESQGIYYLNGVAGAALPAEFSGFAFSHTQPTDTQHVFEVHLGGSEKIYVKTYKDFVSVLIEEGQSKHFGDSIGLMGDFEYGVKLSRDGKTVIDDANAFGQEWQVLDTEPSLFQRDRLPQYPLECTLPTPMQASQLRRRLAETSSADELAAEKACEHWGDGKDDCVFDVLVTGDLEMAIVGAY